jgi:hypothetical protein
VLQTPHVRKPQVHVFHVVVFDQLADVRRHGGSLVSWEGR